MHCLHSAMTNNCLRHGISAILYFVIKHIFFIFFLSETNKKYDLHNLIFSVPILSMVAVILMLLLMLLLNVVFDVVVALVHTNKPTCNQNTLLFFFYFVHA